MPEKVLIFDTTLRDGEQSPGFSMNLEEKLTIARQLAKMKVDVIEAGFPIASPGDFEAVRAVAKEIKGLTVAGLARANHKDIDRCWEAVKYSDDPRIHTFIATSDVHVEKKLRMSKDRVIEIAVDAVKRARKYTKSVEFSPEDAGRTNWEYMRDVLTAVIKAGATTVNIPDTVGYSNPWEFGSLIAYIKENVPNIDEAVISVHCHNDLGLAVANSLAGVKNGARQVECTINGIGERAGNTSLEEVVMILKTRKDFFKYGTGIKTNELYKSSRMLSAITGINVQPNKAIVGANAFAHEAGIHQDGVLKERTTYEIMTPKSVGWQGTSMVMGKHSGRHALKSRLKSLGFDLEGDALIKAFDRFKDLADQKKDVYDADLMAIAEDVTEVKAAEGYELGMLHFTAAMMEGKRITPIAVVSLEKNGEKFEQEATGDGPIDAAMNAIKKITGTKAMLIEYHTKAVTSGSDAQAGTTVVLQESGQRATARSADTDTVIAAIRAYIKAINLLESFKSKKVKKPARKKVKVKAV